MASPSVNRSSSLAFIAFLSILIIDFALRVIFLTRNGIWFDEALVLHYAGQSFEDMMAMIRVGELQPPAYHVVMYLYCHVFGTHPQWIVELPSALISLLGLAYSYRLGRELYDSRFGLVAAALLSVSTYYLKYSWEIRPYAMMATLSIMSTFYLFRMIRHPRQLGAFVGFVLTAGINLNTHYFAVLTLVAQNIFLLSFYRRPPVLRRMLFADGFIAMLFLPWLLVFAEQFADIMKGTYQASSIWIPHLSFPIFMGQFFLLISFNFQRYLSSAVNPSTGSIVWGSLSVSSWIAIVIFLLILAGAVNRLRNNLDRQIAAYWLLFFLLPIGVVTVFSVTVQSVFQQRYFAEAMPGLAFLGAISIRPIRTSISCALLGIVISLGVMDVVTMLRTPHNPAPRRIANYIQNTCRSDDLIIFLSPYYFFPIRYYDQGRHDLRLYSTSGGRAALEVELPIEIRFTPATSWKATKEADRLIFVDDGYYYSRSYQKRVAISWQGDFKLDPKRLRYERRAGPIGRIFSYVPERSK